MQVVDIVNEAAEKAATAAKAAGEAPAQDADKFKSFLFAATMDDSDSDSD